MNKVIIIEIDVKLSTHTYAHNSPTLRTDGLTNDIYQQYCALRWPCSTAHTARKTRDTRRLLLWSF